MSQNLQNHWYSANSLEMHKEEIWQVGRIMSFQTGNPSGTGSSFEILRNEKITRHQDGA